MNLDLSAIATRLRTARASLKKRLHSAQASNPSHADRVQMEQRHFSGCQTHNQLPEIYHYWSNTYLRPKLERIGFSHPDAMFCGYFELAYLANQSTYRHFLSLGTGNCKTEVMLARHLVERGLSDFVIECVDLNPTLLAEGVASAKEASVGDHIVTAEGDANKWTPSTTYAGILANSSLHHIENLEGLFEGIEESLAPTGTFVTSDTVGRNGHMRWPEALTVVHEFWRELPREYTYNHLLQRHESLYDNWDCSAEGFEGIRAQDILPLLLKHFDFDVFVPFANIVDPFIDRPFGPNFASSRKWDAEFIDRVHARDEAEMARGAVKPTHIVAAMCVGRPGTYVPRDGLTPRFCVRSSGRDPRPLRSLSTDGSESTPERLTPASGVQAPAKATGEDAIAVTILPADPKSLDLLVARIRAANPADLQPSAVSVRSEGHDIRIDLEQTTRVTARPPATLDVGLGRFPAGAVTVSVYSTAGLEPVTVVVNVAGQVCEAGSSSPLVDYTDMWWNPDEPGWGMSIHQHSSGRLVATWLVYDESGKPTWYSLQPGSWAGPCAYSGPIYRYGASGSTDLFAPGHVNGASVGSGSLVFADFASGNFTYEILGTCGTKEMVRMQF